MTIEGADDSWDFGSGAGFYVNAPTPKWSKHYKMYDYITKELPAVVFLVNTNRSPSWDTPSFKCSPTRYVIWEESWSHVTT